MRAAENDHRLAIAHVGQGELDDAITNYEKTIKLDPKLAMADDTAVLLKDYRESIVSHPEQTAAFSNRLRKSPLVRG